LDELANEYLKDIVCKETRKTYTSSFNFLFDPDHKLLNCVMTLNYFKNKVNQNRLLLDIIRGVGLKKRVKNKTKEFEKQENDKEKEEELTLVGENPYKRVKLLETKKNNNILIILLLLLHHTNQKHC